jgi:hypothetical protein
LQNLLHLTLISYQQEHHLTNKNKQNER